MGHNYLWEKGKKHAEKTNNSSPAPKPETKKYGLIGSNEKATKSAPRPEIPIVAKATVDRVNPIPHRRSLIVPPPN
jgi:hypothetical protein